MCIVNVTKDVSTRSVECMVTGTGDVGAGVVLYGENVNICK